MREEIGIIRQDLLKLDFCLRSVYEPRGDSRWGVISVMKQVNVRGSRRGFR